MDVMDVMDVMAFSYQRLSAGRQYRRTASGKPTRLAQAEAKAPATDREAMLTNGSYQPREKRSASATCVGWAALRLEAVLKKR